MRSLQPHLGQLGSLIPAGRLHEICTEKCMGVAISICHFLMRERNLSRVRLMPWRSVGQFRPWTFTMQKIPPMMAIIASLPFSILAVGFFVFAFLCRRWT